MKAKGYNSQAYGSGKDMKGMPSDGVFKNAPGMSMLSTTDAQQWQAGKMQILPMNKGGYDQQAFDYMY